MTNSYISTDETSKTNFIRQIIDADLVAHKHTLVRTRFSPEPNGYLHIGHAKAICLNFGIALDYSGQCNLRFDDTNPVKEDIEFVNAIKQDIQWLGFNWSGDIHYASDYFDQLYYYALELINKNLAYVDELSPNKVREYRGTLTVPGTNSPYRDRSVEENLALFAQMRNGSLPEGSACLRAKIDMASPFMIMRDPVLYRIKFAEHHQTGNTWCIYPMYDFTHCISDALEGITHSLCTLEFQDNRRLYDWVLDNISIDVHPRQYEYSRLNIEYVIMSKRQLNILVQQNIVEGWDDPRMPTISGLRRRGYTAASIRKFCNRIGVTKQENNIEIAALEACLRDDLNAIAPRAMAVLNPVKLVIENWPNGYYIDIVMPNHPNKSEMGTRKVTFSREIYIDRADFREDSSSKYKRLVLGQEVRLRYAYIIKAERIDKDAKGNITVIYCRYYQKSNGRKVKGIIQWVSATSGVAAEFRIYNRLFSTANPGAAENFLTTINPNSLVIYHGFVEASLLTAKAGQLYQFEREGYFCADNRYFSNSHPVFNRTVGLLRKN